MADAIPRWLCALDRGVDRVGAWWDVWGTRVVFGGLWLLIAGSVVGWNLIALAILFPSAPVLSWFAHDLSSMGELGLLIVAMIGVCDIGICVLATVVAIEGRYGDGEERLKRCRQHRDREEP